MLKIPRKELTTETNKMGNVAATGALDGAFRFTCPSCGAQNEFMLSSEQEDNGCEAQQSL
eukprot:2098675-Amphidinium_carterae.1